MKLEHIAGYQMPMSDRTSFTIQLVTDQGQLELSMSFDQIELLLTNLEEMEARAYLLNPAAPAIGEQIRSRLKLVDAYETGGVTHQGTYYVILNLRTGQVVRQYAIKTDHALQMADHLLDSVSKGNKPQGVH